MSEKRITRSARHENSSESSEQSEPHDNPRTTKKPRLSAATQLIHEREELDRQRKEMEQEWAKLKAKQAEIEKLLTTGTGTAATPTRETKPARLPEPPVAPALVHVADTDLASLPTAFEVIVVATDHPVADVVLDAATETAAASEGSRVRHVLNQVMQQNGVPQLRCTPHSAPALIADLRRAAVKRGQDVLQNLKAALAAHGERTACITCHQAKLAAKAETA